MMSLVMTFKEDGSGQPLVRGAADFHFDSATSPGATLACVKQAAGADVSMPIH